MLIDVPFSPRFIFEYAKHFDAAQPKKYKLGYLDAFTFSHKEINKALEENEVTKTDMPRIHWKVGGVDWIQGADLKNASKKYINLNDDEVNALHAFAMSNGEDPQQWGIYGRPYLSINPWLIHYDIMLPFGILSNPVICRTKNGFLVQMNQQTNNVGLQLSKKQFADGMSTAYENTQHPAIIIMNQFEITSHNNGSFSVAVDKANYQFTIDKYLWDAFVIPKAFRTLKAKKQFDFQDLYEFTPCLRDPQFAKEFITRLERESDEVQKIASRFIALCFENHPKNIENILSFSNQKIKELILIACKENQLQNQYQRYIDYLQNYDFMESKNKGALSKEEASEKINILKIFINETLHNDKVSRREKLKEFATFKFLMVNEADDLKNECIRYMSYLENINKNESEPYDKRWYASEKISVLRELNKILGDSSLPENVKCHIFAREFKKSKSIFRRGADTTDIKFLKAVVHILASIASLGIYAGARAYYSNKNYGLAKFWKSQDGIHIEKIKKVSEAIDKINYKSNNKPRSK